MISGRSFLTIQNWQRKVKLKIWWESMRAWGYFASAPFVHGWHPLGVSLIHPFEYSLKKKKRSNVWWSCGLWICGNLRSDWMVNEMIREKVGVPLIQDKRRQAKLKWSGTLKRIVDAHLGLTWEGLTFQCKRERDFATVGQLRVTAAIWWGFHSTVEVLKESHQTRFDPFATFRGHALVFLEV